MSARQDEQTEWRECVGQAVMLSLACAHEGSDFGDKAVCATCFASTQKIGAYIERQCAAAWERGRAAEARANPFGKTL